MGFSTATASKHFYIYYKLYKPFVPLPDHFITPIYLEIFQASIWKRR